MLCTIGKDACSSHGDDADGQGSEHHGALLDNFGWEARSEDLAPLVCGTLGEGLGWRYGFAAAGVGMTIALVVYLYAVPMLPPDEMRKAKAAGLDKKPLDRNEWRAVLALITLFLPTTMFWATYEQQGNTIALWADELTDRTIDLIVWHGEIPVTWFQAPRAGLAHGCRRPRSKRSVWPRDHACSNAYARPTRPP